MANSYEGITDLISVSSGVLGNCHECGQRGVHVSIGSEVGSITESIKHYIQTHGYRLLHVGQETSQAACGPRNESGRRREAVAEHCGHSRQHVLAHSLALDTLQSGQKR
jgi:hypothetical protein